MTETKSSLPSRDTFRDFDEWDPFKWLHLRPMRMPRWSEEFFADSPQRRVMPAIDVQELDDSYDITVEVPGVDKNDLTVECRDGVLTVRGEKKSEREEKQGRARMLERAYGTFSRSLSLPGDANSEKVEAKYQDGVLHVSIGKRPEAKSRAITIKG